MNYIVMDLEFNWPYGSNLSENNGVRLRNEIIEIGAVKMDESLICVGTFKMFVKPKAYIRVNRKVRRLTGISTYMLWYVNPFPEVIRRFFAWCGDECSFVTWSRWDIRVLKENMAYHGLNDRGLPVCYDLQRMFDDQVSRQGCAVALSKAVESLDIDLKGRHFHDAFGDAYGTAEILKKLDLHKGLNGYSVS